MKSVLRFDVAIDDQPHDVPAASVVAFGCGPTRADFGFEVMLDLWLEVPDGLEATQSVQVVAERRPVSDDWTHLATAIDGRSVWHLYQLPGVVSDANAS